MNKTRILVALSAILASGGAAAKSADRLDIEWSLETGLGYETNAFHAPDHTYVDYYADPTGAVTVTPVEQGGFFIPLKVKAGLTKPMSKRMELNTSYLFSSDFFPALSDANSTYHSLSIGTERTMGRKRNRAKAYTGVFARSLHKVYVDRDNGLPKTAASGAGVSNRYTYTSFGAEADYERRLSRSTNIGFEGELEQRDYEDPVAWSQYDHTSLMVGTYLEHEFSKATDGEVAFSIETEDYSERRAYTASGSLLASNPLLTYTFNVLELGLKHRLNPSTYLYLDYEHERRSDNNVGYNNMTQNSYKLRVNHDMADDLRLKVKFEVYDRDYPNAFNFEDPARGAKSASGTSLDLRGEYTWSRHKTYFAEIEHDSRRNTDDRYQYNNTALLLGAEWDY